MPKVNHIPKCNISKTNPKPNYISKRIRLVKLYLNLTICPNVISAKLCLNLTILLKV